MELALVMGLVGILVGVTPTLILNGVRTFVFVPNSRIANHVAMEILHAITEGSYSTLPAFSGQIIRGLRVAARQVPYPPAVLSAQSAIWLAEENRIGYFLPLSPATTADDRYVLIRLEAEQIKREVFLSLPPCPPSSWGGETLPYEAADAVRILTSGSPLFHYYRSNGLEVSPPGGCAPSTTIRRVDIAFVAQTGSGNFDQGDTQERVMSSVAIRFP